MANKIVMNNKDYCCLLAHIALDLDTKYKNKFPYNLGYYHADKTFSFDCWDLPKAIIWGWKETKKVGYYAKPDYSTGLKDWGGITIMSKCSSKSTDFTKVPNGAFMLNAAGTHAGTFVGEFTYEGKVYNTIEATVAFGGGVVPSYTSSTGGRYSHKGGTKNGAWAKHGKLPWIEYKDGGKEKDTAMIEVKILKPTTPVTKDPQVGTIQTLLNQKNKAKLSVDNYYGPSTQKAVKAWQKKKKLEQTGICDQATWESLIG